MLGLFMRNLKPIIIVAVTAGIITWYMPWSMVAACAFFVSITHNLKPKDGFISGFLGVVLCWLVIALWRDLPNEHILSDRMAGLLGLPNGWLFMLVTVIIGGVVGALAGWSGGMMNKAFRS